MRDQKKVTCITALFQKPQEVAVNKVTTSQQSKEAAMEKKDNVALIKPLTEESKVSAGRIQCSKRGGILGKDYAF